MERSETVLSVVRAYQRIIEEIFQASLAEERKIHRIHLRFAGIIYRGELALEGKFLVAFRGKAKECLYSSGILIFCLLRTSPRTPP